jgi:predicted RNase H-like nuclease (RuvC/YqgF family)
MVSANFMENVGEDPKKTTSKMPDTGINITNISVLSTKLKILEERYSTLRKKIQNTDQNILQAEKEEFNEFKLINDDLVNIKKNMKNLSEKISLLEEEVNNFADKRDFTVLQKYVEYWQPMDFVTRKEVNDFLRKKFNQ